MEPKEVLKKLEGKLPALAVLIYKYSGIDVKDKLKVELEESRNRVYFRISSKDLFSDLCPIGRSVFTEFNLYFWGGDFVEEKNSVWFNPKVSYSHPSGGSNGTDFIWSSLEFDIDTESWIPGYRLGH